MTRPELDGLFHTGMVVDDLAAAMGQFSEALGFRWAEPLRMQVPVWSSGSLVARDSWTTYSAAPGDHPRLELIEDVAGTVWDAGTRPRLHHVGLWSDQLSAQSDRLAALGWERMVTDGPDGRPRSFAYHDPGQGGLYVELVTSSLKPDMLPWLEGRAPAPGRHPGASEGSV